MNRQISQSAAIASIAAFLVVSLSGCAPPPGGPTPSSPVPPAVPAPLYQVDLALVDEAGAPVLGAVVRGDGSPRTSADGQVRVSRCDPVLLVIEAAGYLSEPVVVGPDLAGAPVPVRLLARTSPTGATRLALHFGGDVMLGRRYLTGSADRPALVEVGDGGALARSAVAAVAPLFRAADVRMVNLETVVGSLPAAAAYEGKRFLLQSPPEVLEALRELGVDVAVLGNNHTRDWLSAGVASTIAHLDAAGTAHAGGGLTEREADEAAVISAAGVKVGVVSFTTVNGDFVNDSLPDAGSTPPANLPPRGSWSRRASFRWCSTGIAPCRWPGVRRGGCSGCCTSGRRSPVGASACRAWSAT